MQWFVYYHDMNKNEIKPFDIFHHTRFADDVNKHLKKCSDFDSFSAAVKHELQYYFWCKCEYEIVIVPWCGRSTEGIKVDIYSQVMLNFDRFIEYLWSFKRIRRKTVKDTKKET